MSKYLSLEGFFNEDSLAGEGEFEAELEKVKKRHRDRKEFRGDEMAVFVQCSFQRRT